MVWKINNNCQIFIEKTDSIAGRQKEIIPHVSAYYVDKYTTISEKGVKTGSNRLCGTANQELLAGYMLYKYLGISSDEQLVRNEHGKPEIAAGYKNESVAFFKSGTQRSICGACNIRQTCWCGHRAYKAHELQSGKAYNAKGAA